MSCLLGRARRAAQGWHSGGRVPPRNAIECYPRAWDSVGRTCFSYPVAQRNRLMMLRPLLLLPAVALVLALTSCSKSGLVNAKGRLTYKGKGVPSTHVFFWPEEEGKRRSTG